MAGTGNFKLDSLRPNRFEGERILLALAIAVLVHVLLWGGYELAREIHVPPRLRWLTLAKPVPQPKEQTEQPLEFVTVETPSTQAPEKAKYISNHNSVAADNNGNLDLNNPLLNGKQTDVPKTEDSIRAQFSPAQAAANQQQANNPQQTAEAKAAVNSGDLTLGKPDNGTQQEPQRPRTIKEALAQMANKFPGMTMQEDGGVHRRAQVPSFDVKITGFGDYDERFVEAVSQNWWNLLESQRFSLDRTGKVVLIFRLNYDGTISNMRFAQNNVGDLLGYVCEKAVLDGQPYERWSEDMRLKLGSYTDVQFTFDYFSDL